MQFSAVRGAFRVTHERHQVRVIGGDSDLAIVSRRMSVDVIGRQSVQVFWIVDFNGSGVIANISTKVLSQQDQLFFDRLDAVSRGLVLINTRPSEIPQGMFDKTFINRIVGRHLRLKIRRRIVEPFVERQFGT